MKKIFCFLLAFILLLYPTTTYASDSFSPVNIEYFEDGSYMITIIEAEASTESAPYANTVTKSKTAKYYENNTAKWYVKVTGTYTYGNGSSKCTKSSVSAGSYVSNWKISNKSSSKRGNTATAKATAKKYYDGTVINTLSKTVTLTCSPSGTFS